MISFFPITLQKSVNISTGDPQGSIRGLLLFIIYINHIVNSSNLFDFIIYADDTTLSNTLENIIRNKNNTDNINMELASISDWLKTNKLSLSFYKTKYMIFHTPQKMLPI